MGDQEAALATLVEYIEQRPDDHAGYMDIAAIHRRRGEHDLARENIERAILIQPLLPELTAELAELDTNVGRFDDARAGYARALELARNPGREPISSGSLAATIGFGERWTTPSGRWRSGSTR